MCNHGLEAALSKEMTRQDETRQSLENREEKMVGFEGLSLGNIRDGNRVMFTAQISGLVIPWGYQANLRAAQVVSSRYVTSNMPR